MKINGIHYKDTITLKELAKELKKRGEFEEFAERVKDIKVKCETWEEFIDNA